MIVEEGRDLHRSNEKRRNEEGRPQRVHAGSSFRDRLRIACSVWILLGTRIRAGGYQGFLDDEPVVTHHKVAVHGRTLSYTARAGCLSIRDEEQVVHARMFYASYTLDQPASAPLRPLMFVWNGGPGSNAALLELGRSVRAASRSVQRHRARTPVPPWWITKTPAAICRPGLR